MVEVLLAGKNFSEGMSVGLSRLGIAPVMFSEDDTIPEPELFGAVYFSGEFLTQSDKSVTIAKELCRKCAELSVPVVFDPELEKVSPDKYNIISETAALGVIFVPSIEEGRTLSGKQTAEEISDYFLELGAAKIVVKLDKNGAYYKSAKESGYAPTFRADKVVDTNGAGNAFSSGLISGITEEIPLSEAVVRANACGCIAIQTEGDLDCLPSREKVREYMLNHRFVVDECKFY